MIVTCERCGGRFEPQLKERPLKGGGAERRFRCSWCNKWYTVAIITPLGVKLMQQIQQVEADLKDSPGRSGLIEQRRMLQEQLRPEITKPQ